MANNSPKWFMKNVESLRKAKGWTAKELAKRVGSKNISGYLHGKTVPGLEVVDKFADAFGVSTDQLLSEPGAPEPKPLVIEPTILDAIEMFSELFQALKKGDLDHPFVRQVDEAIHKKKRS